MTFHSLFYRTLLAVTVSTSILAATPSWSQDLRIAMTNDITGFDPHDTSDNLSYSVQSGVYERLFQFDRQMKLVPVLATDYQVNDKATEFTINLHQGITFSDGTPFDAKAVKINLDRLADQKKGLKRNSMFSMIDHTDIVNDYCIRVVLKNPFGAMINTLAHPSAVMISPRALEQYPDEQDLRIHPVGTGPFTFVHWNPGRDITLAKNPHYWHAGWPKVDKVILYPTPESATRVARLRAGEVDAVMPLDAQLASTVKKDKRLNVVNDPGVFQSYIAINNLRPALSDPRVRKALNHAVDRRIWLRAIYGNMGTVASSPMADSVVFFSHQAPYEYNPDKARELLKEAGHANDLNLNLWTANDTSSVRAAQVFKEMFGQVGVKVKVVPMDSGTRNNRLWGVRDPHKAGFDLYLAGWSPSTGDADWALRPLYTTKAWVPTLYNVAYYSNVKVDDAVQGALDTADDTVRAKYYAEAQKLIWDDAPLVFLGNPDNLTGLTKSLNGVYMLPDTTFSFTQAQFQ